MKFRKLAMLMVLCMAVFLMPLKADATTVASGKCGDNLTWVLDDAGTLTVTGTGGMVDYSDETQVPWYAQRADIRTAVFGEGVTTVGSFAFYDCSALTAITIPKSLEGFGYDAFYGCNSLTDIYISDLTGWMNTMDAGAWSRPNLAHPDNFNIQLYLNGNLIENLVIPSGVTTIAPTAFMGCSSLKSVSIPSSVTGIGFQAFGFCSGLTSVSLSEGLTYIGSGAFQNCTGLESITIPGSVTEMDGDVFATCTNLKSVTIKGKIPSIGQNLFYKCENLTSLVVPDGVTSIGYHAFYNCYALESISLPDSLESIESEAFHGCKKLKSITIPEKVTEISDYTFLYCSGLTSVQLPTGLTRIGDSAFGWCGLTSISIPASVSSIGSCAFIDCPLKSITLPNGITHIGAEAFSGCTKLSSISIPDSVVSIGSRAFWNCASLTKVTLPDGLSEIADWTFYHCLELESVEIPDSVAKIGEYAFQSCQSLTTAELPDGLTALGTRAFRDCTALTSVVIPAGIKNLENGVFSGCTSLTSVSLPDNLESIGASAFWSCTSLKKITLPDTLTNIGSEAFEEAGLTSITIPASVTNLGQRVFCWCDNLVSVTFEGNAPAIAEDAFFETRTTAHYPTDNSTWTADVMQDYGGTITWDAGIALRITSQPVSVTVAEGETAKVTVEAVGDGLSYRWYYKDSGASSYTYTSTFTTNTYSVPMTEARDGRRVLCRVYDKYGNVVQSDSAMLSMEHYVEILQQPQSVTVAEGETAKVTVKATGDGLTYRWYYKNSGESSYTYTSTFTGNTYSVTMNEARDGRRVLCRVYDKYGNVVQSSSALLSMEHYVEILQQPESVTVAEGETAKVTVIATGDGLTYRWYYKDSGATSYTYTSTFTTNTYSVPMTEARDGRRVLCRVYDKYGNVVQSSSALLSMEHYVQIIQQPESVTVAEGEIAKVTVKATGDGLYYRWYYKDPGATGYTYTSTYTTNTYSVTMTEARNGRRVLCRVYDKYGNVVQSSSALLKMS